MVAERLLDALLPETVPPLSARSPTMDAATISELAHEEHFIPTHIAGMPPLTIAMASTELEESDRWKPAMYGR